MLVYSTAFFALFGVVFSSYSDNTVTLEYELESCVSNTASEKSCMTSVKTGLEKIYKTIEDVKKLEYELTSIVNGINELSSALDLAKYAPAVIGAVGVLRRSIEAIETPVTTARSEVITFAGKLHTWKSAARSSIYILDTAIIYEQHLHSNCTNGESFVTAARSCVDSMGAGPARKSAEEGLEAFGKALNPEFNKLNKALVHSRTVCADIKPFIDIALGWPDLSAPRKALESITNAITPIREFFDSLRNLLDNQICMNSGKTETGSEDIGNQSVEEATDSSTTTVDPWQRLLSRGKRSLTADETVQLRQLLKKGLDDLTAEKTSAKPVGDYVTTSNTCYSARQVLDEVGQPYQSLVEDAVLLIAKNLPPLPDFTLPGVPYLNLPDVNTTLDLPSLEFKIDFDLYAKFVPLNFKCITDVLRLCEASDGHLKIDCGLDLASHQQLSGNNVLESLAQQAASTESTLNGEKDDTNMLSPPVDSVEHMNPDVYRAQWPKGESLAQAASDESTLNGEKDGTNMLLSAAVDSVKHMSPEEKMNLKSKLEEMGVKIPVPNERETTTAAPTTPAPTTPASTTPAPTTQYPKISEEDLAKQIKRMLASLNVGGR